MPETLRDDVAFVYHNGRSYTLTEVNVPTIDAMISNINDVQRRRVDTITQNLRQEFVREAFELSSNEAAEIVRIGQQNAVSVPNNRACMPLVVINGMLCPVRAVIYSPSSVSASLYGWTSCLGTNVLAGSAWDKINTTLGYNIIEQVPTREERINTTLVVKGKCPWSCVALYSICRDNILCTKSGFHTTGSFASSEDGSIYWYRCCTGNTPAQEYWALPYKDFVNAVCSLNPDSFASSEITFDRNITKNLAQIVTSFTDMTVSHIRPQEGWNNAS